MIYKIIPLLLILTALVLSACLYPAMPDKFASHWNQNGNVDGYMPKSWGIFLMPAISLFIFLLLSVLPKIDPLKRNYKTFKKQYEQFIIVIIAFFLYIHLLTLLWNLGITFNFIRLLTPAFVAMFFYAGVLIENAKRNWMVGIRTPWTLSNEKVWDKTHKLGGKLFKISALITLLGIFIPKYAIWVLITPVLATSLYLIVYSYLEYKKLSKK